MTILAFQRHVLQWHQKNKRNFPFRKTRNPYRILVSEVMLQQTQITRVLPKYEQFLKEFPDFKKLAAAKTHRLLLVWQGLGYWRRALFLRETAQIVVKKFGGSLPQDPKILQSFPGIGPYTAHAVACFAFGNSTAFLDTNIRKVYLHFFFKNRKGVSDKEILTIAQKAVWQKDPRMWHYALFDYGSTMLKDKKIARKSRHYHRQSPFRGSFRSFRTKALRFVLSQPEGKIPQSKLSSFLAQELVSQKSSFKPQEIIAALLKDELLKKTKQHYSI